MIGCFIQINSLSKLIIRHNPSILIKRHKLNKKWATNFTKQSPTQKALQYFDTYYKPVYDDLWPSIRVSLLSGQKYGALINNFCDNDSIGNMLKLGAEDMLELARKTSNIRPSKEYGFKDNKQTQLNTGFQNSCESQQNTEVFDKELLRDSDLHEFVPVEKVYSERELILKEESQKGVFVDNEINVEILKEDNVIIPDNLRVFTFKPGNVSNFPAPKPNSVGLLGYYMLDASSVLPVIALDLRSNDTVLDLCAAPGGKSLTILQTLLPGSLTSNDISYGRLYRLKEILRWYCPDKEKSIRITKYNGLQYTTPEYDKVLVDVPCSTDRHVVTDENNNFFSPSRSHDRLSFAEKQKQLLVSGIKSCKPGGSIVYSTCTLSPPQNDGVIQAAIEEIWNETKIDIAIQDLSALSYKFHKTFRFYSGCRYGQLVIPCLMSNFGPMYFCKIKRLN